MTRYSPLVLSKIDHSEACAVKIPNFELQLPPARGQLATESLLGDIAADLIVTNLFNRLSKE
ncbi:hypothetical protein EV401DRAFT_1141652 [Pisolithus croceorrhizus]|nr:hypothetical protein EV401DRAFT_1141652 [Pisolithus croceorrhizus]